MNQPPAAITDLRSGSEPVLDGKNLGTPFPELQTTSTGTARAKGAVRIILRDYLPKPEIKSALTGKLARGIKSAVHQNDASADGYPLLLDVPGTRDGRHILQSYLDGLTTLDPEDVKGILFAICRECRRGSNGGHANLIKLNDLAALAIFEIQQQRRIETSSVALKL